MRFSIVLRDDEIKARLHITDKFFLFQNKTFIFLRSIHSENGQETETGTKRG